MIFGKRYTDMWFKDTEEGRTFYPSGAAGPGYILSPSEEALVRARLNLWLTAAGWIIVALIVLQPFIGIIPTIQLLAIPLLILMLLYYALLRRAKARWKKASVRITRSEIRRSYATGLSRARVVLMFIASGLMTALSATLLIVSLRRSDEMALLWLTSTVFFGACIASSIIIARLRK